MWAVVEAAGYQCELLMIQEQCCLAMGDLLGAAVCADAAEEWSRIAFEFCEGPR